MKTKLSIITINYNNSAGLCNTALSLGGQCNRDFEWIIVDGGSTDGSLDNCFIDFGLMPKIISEEDDGIYDAMNKGALLASGNFFLFLNSGDVLATSLVVDEIYEEMSKSCNADIFLFGFIYNGKVRMPKFMFWRFFSLPTSHQSIIYSSRVFERFKYNIEYRYAGDFEHFLRAVSSGLLVRRVKKVLAINEPYGSNSNIDRVLFEYRKVMNIYLPSVVCSLLCKIKMLRHYSSL